MFTEAGRAAAAAKRDADEAVLVKVLGWVGTVLAVLSILAESVGAPALSVWLILPALAFVAGALVVGVRLRLRTGRAVQREEVNSR